MILRSGGAGCIGDCGGGGVGFSCTTAGGCCAVVGSVDAAGGRTVGVAGTAGAGGGGATTTGGFTSGRGCGVISLGAGAGGAGGGVAATLGGSGATGFAAGGAGGAGLATGLVTVGAAAVGFAGGAAAASVLPRMAASTSPGLEIFERSILVLISSAAGRECLSSLPVAAPWPEKCLRTRSASSSSSELE